MVMIVMVMIVMVMVTVILCMKLSSAHDSVACAI